MTTLNPFALQFPPGRTPHEYAAAVGKRAWGRYASRKDWENSLYHGPIVPVNKNASAPEDTLADKTRTWPTPPKQAQPRLAQPRLDPGITTATLTIRQTL